MGDISGNQTFETFRDIIQAFAPCMHDYLFVYDLRGDTFYITEHALARFNIPGSLFRDFLETQKVFVHPDDSAMLIDDLRLLISGRKVNHNLEYRWLGRDGSPIWINCRGRIVESGDERRLMIGCINEIGERSKADNISGLLGESSLRDYIKELFPNIADAMFLRVGIDDFKLINERHGTEYGNFVLREVAGLIESCLTPNQSVYRVIADEFMVVDTSGADYDSMNKLYHSIRSSVDNVIAREHYKAVFTISGGLLSLKDMQESQPGCVDEIMKLSEFALTEAKNRGKNQMYFFKPDDYDLFLRTRYVRSCLRQALGNNFKGFELFFQPIVSVGGASLFAAETLLRFRSPGGENIFPMEFIPILEESGLIIPVGKWIIRNSLAMCKKMREKYPDFMVSINLSYIQLLKSPMFEDITDALAEAGLPASCLIVELTESGHLEDSLAVQNVWKRLRAIGVSIALDDFGTGYSNLINIGNLKPNIVKIDRSFTLKALNNEYEHELLTHIVRMIHSIGLRLVVEGIETEAELQSITALGPDFIQGYYYSKPCPEQDFADKYLTGR